MSQFQTIVILDRDAAAAVKVLSNEHTILVPLTSVAQFRHFASQSVCDIWLCDLSIEGLDYLADLDLVRRRNPQARVVLTAPATHAPAATTLQQQGSAAAFVPKPWRVMSLLQAVLRNGPPPEEKGRPSPATAGAATPPRPAKSPPATVAAVPAAKPATRKPVSCVPPAHGAPAKPRPSATATSAFRTPRESRYRLEQLVGEGGVGHVYRAFDLLLDMEVAIKILRKEFVSDEAVLHALKSEARLCMRLTHPHIVRFHDVGQREDTFFLVMEYVRGQTLGASMQNPRSREHDYVRNVAKAIGSALSYAHAQGVLHNDLTPSNIIIDASGLLKLIDFGIASVISQRREKTAFVFGTPAYMSPEQLRCDPVVNATTDVFSLGVLLHQMLTGALPQREGATTDELALQPRPPVTGVLAPVAEVLNRALAFEADRRWPSVAELVTAFDFALDQ